MGHIGGGCERVIKRKRFRRKVREPGTEAAGIFEYAKKGDGADIMDIFGGPDKKTLGTRNVQVMMGGH